MIILLKISAKSYRPFLLWMLVFCYAQGYAQELRMLNQSTIDRVSRLEELVSYYTEEEDFAKVTSYLNQISYAYWENDRPDKAAETFYRVAEYYERMNDLVNLHKVYSNIGLIYLDLENIDEADKAFTRNLDVQRRSLDSQGIATALVDLAYTKNLLKDYREAISLLEEAMQISLQINYETVLPIIYMQLSKSYFEIGNTRLGEEYRKKYNDLREYVSRQTMRGEFQEREEQSQVEILRQEIEAGERKAEMERNKLQFQLEQDSISAVVKAQEDSLILARRIEQIQRQDIEILEKESELNKTEIERQQAVQNFQQLIIYSVLGGLGFVMILVFIMFWSNRARKKANQQLAAKNIQIEQASEKLQIAFEKIEEQNFRITQSISYAKEIQRALFPPIETLSNFLPESFIFFRPVDLVSGDFYWFREAEHSTSKIELVESIELVEKSHNTTILQKPSHQNGSWLPFQGDKFIITAVDCTGHGVPGAFMSMIGYNLLDSITGSGTTHPDKILGKLHYGVRNALKQEETTNRDGMDISMCVINKQNRTVEFAGANNPVIYITDGELHTIKGDMLAIGGSQKKTDRTYQAHTIQVEQPTWFYIFTDGFTDQFGGEEGKKFSMKNFKELLLSIYQKPMAEQRQIMEDEFIKWRGDGSQIDDVLVIGFKI
jgi:serine phosphatase RsbU (regulator of sigma subunit)